MESIKEHIFAVCIVLIITGIFMRILPERSDRKTLKFVVTLVLIISVFKIDISPLEDFLKLSATDENNESISVYESDLKGEISNTLSKEIETVIFDEYKRYDEGVKIGVELSENKLIVSVHLSSHLSKSEKETVQLRITDKLGENVEFIYKESDSGA